MAPQAKRRAVLEPMMLKAVSNDPRGRSIFSICENCGVNLIQQRRAWSRDGDEYEDDDDEEDYDDGYDPILMLLEDVLRIYLDHVRVYKYTNNSYVDEWADFYNNIFDGHNYRCQYCQGADIGNQAGFSHLYQ